MSEIKRAQLIPFGVQKLSEKSVKEPRKTIRIKVVLPESTEDTCPEFNYKDELAAAKKREKYKDSANLPNGLNRSQLFEDNDDDVKRIAREMEEKYGTGVSLNKKKKRNRKDDYADIGMGYDESDSFIDNTDGYDEMIPQNVTTLHGGFYINSGALEFKTDDKACSDLSSTSSSSEGDDEDDEEDDDDNGSRRKPSRKRIIESSDETDRENKTDVDNEKQQEKKRKLQNGGNGMQQSLKKKLLGQPEKIYIKKRRLLDPQKKTVKELLKEKREDLNMMSIPQDVNKTPPNSVELKEERNVKSNISATIESVVKASVDMNTSNNNNTINNKPDNKAIESSQEKPVHLPENLPTEITEIISMIKESVAKGDKNNIFDSSVNSQLLRLERKCKCLGKPSKMKVYEHLSTSICCKPEVLLRKARSLVLDDEQQRLKSLLSKLKNEVDKIMPTLLESHEIESQKVLQRKFSHENNDEDNKSLRMPKRRFQWNDLTKKLLKDILMLKKRCFLLEGKQKEVLDAQMTNFLKAEIQVLWPEGWMSMNALNKIYTTYADPKRTLNSSLNTSSSLLSPSTTTQSSIATTTTIINTTTATITTATTTTTTTTTNSLKNLPTFSNSNLSITPIIPVPQATTTNTIKSGSGVDTVVNLKQEKEKPNKEVECKLKLKPASELLKPSLVNQKSEPPQLLNDDSVIIVDSLPPTTLPTTITTPSVNNTLNLSKKDNDYFQVIDLSDKNDFHKLKSTTMKQHHHQQQQQQPPHQHHHQQSHHHKQQKHHHHHHQQQPQQQQQQQQQQKQQSTSCGDDIEKVMEGLKALQKMSSSPKKSVDSSQTNSAAVSVIAVNKSFSGKSSSQTTNSGNQSVMHRVDYMKPQPQPSPTAVATTTTATATNNLSDFNSSFQDEFQKQLYTTINHITSNSNKNSFNSSVDRYPHIASSGSSAVPSDKYFQNSNNNYPPNSNGHKSASSTSQAGSYSLLDDMFANLLTQYGYAKEASSSSKK